MILSNTSKYAIRACLYIALQSDKNQRIDIQRIGKALSIPSPFLAKILQLLAKHRLLSSAKGPNGGFSLHRQAKEITLYEIVTIIDGEDIFEQCLISNRSCYEEDLPCPLHENFASIRAEIVKLFKEQTLQDLVTAIKSSKKDIIL